MPQSTQFVEREGENYEKKWKTIQEEEKYREKTNGENERVLNEIQFQLKIDLVFF